MIQSRIASRITSWVARSARLLLPMWVVVGCCAQMPAAAAEDVIRFGAPLPMTGPLAPEAIKQQQGYDLWAEQANKAGGISIGSKKYKVEIVYTDYQSNTPRAVQATEQMITPRTTSTSCLGHSGPARRRPPAGRAPGGSTSRAQS